MGKKKFIWDEDDIDSHKPSPKTKKNQKQVAKQTNSKKKPASKKATPQNKKQVKKTKKKHKKASKKQHQQVKKVNHKKNTKKRRKKRFILLFFIFIMVMIFAPLWRINEIAVSTTYFIDEAEIATATGFEKGKRYSTFELFNISLDEATDAFISDLSTNYDYPTKTLTMDVVEIKPLAMDNAGKLYYGDGEEIKSSSEMNYVAPKIIGFDEKMQQDLLKALNTLDYVIIKEIVAIEYVADEVLPDLVKMQMADGNVVYITISEISNKMPYYLQMSQIIDQEANKKPGIIHLERGNYYEPL